MAEAAGTGEGGRACHSMRVRGVGQGRAWWEHVTTARASQRCMADRANVRNTNRRDQHRHGGATVAARAELLAAVRREGIGS